MHILHWLDGLVVKYEDSEVRLLEFYFTSKKNKINFTERSFTSNKFTNFKGMIW